MRRAQEARDLDDIAKALRDERACHTAILYGSRAAGNAGPGSDYDVAGFAAIKAVERITGPWRDAYLDIFVHPEERLATASADLLHLRGGKVLFEKGGAGTRFLAMLDKLHAEGPERLGESELRARRHWAWKMRDRAASEDAEGDFRRAWLLTALLEDYFHMRGEWYEGPRRSLAHLAATNPQLHAQFEAALRPGASLATIERLVESVAGPRPDVVDFAKA